MPVWLCDAAATSDWSRENSPSHVMLYVTHQYNLRVGRVRAGPPIVLPRSGRSREMDVDAACMWPLHLRALACPLSAISCMYLAVFVVLFAGPARAASAYCKGRMSLPPCLPHQHSMQHVTYTCTHHCLLWWQPRQPTAFHLTSLSIARRAAKLKRALSRLAGDRYPQDRQRNGQGPLPKATAL